MRHYNRPHVRVRVKRGHTEILHAITFRLCMQGTCGKHTYSKARRFSDQPQATCSRQFWVEMSGKTSESRVLNPRCWAFASRGHCACGLLLCSGQSSSIKEPVCHQYVTSTGEGEAGYFQANLGCRVRSCHNNTTSSQCACACLCSLIKLKLGVMRHVYVLCEVRG